MYYNYFIYETSLEDKALQKEGKFIYNPDQKKNYKVGKSITPEQRMKTLQTGNCRDLVIYRIVEFATKKEASDKELELHRILKEYKRHILGEWFSLSDNDVDSLIRAQGLTIARVPTRMRDQQLTCLNQFHNHMIKGDESRGKLIACCGFGKTFTTFCMILNTIRESRKDPDEMNIGIFTILTTTVNLIEQMHAEYERLFNIFMPEDVRVFRLGGKNSCRRRLRRILHDANNKKYISVIISTHQSSKYIYRYYQDNTVDIGTMAIYDEAHRTTGYSAGGNKVLGDNNNFKQQQTLLAAAETGAFVPEKSVFMTATQKYIEKAEKTCETTCATNYSMDNPDVYGETFFDYSFKKGIEDGILVDFETVFLQENGEISDEIRKKIKALSIKDEKEIYFSCVASFLQNCINRYDLRHVLVYTNNSVAAKYFIDLYRERGCKDHVIDMISAKDTQGGTYKKKIKEFEKEDKVRILVAIRIFDEGVDVKCIDSILFAQVRHSNICIKQNIGRALRVWDRSINPTIKYPKKKAYVLIPNVIHFLNNDTDSDISNSYSSKFKEVRKCIKEISTGEINYMSQFSDLARGEEDEKIERPIIRPRKKLETRVSTSLTDDEKRIILEEICKSLNITSKDKSYDISNTSFVGLKRMVQKKNICSIKEFAKTVESLRLENPFQLYPTQWISWNHFFGKESKEDHYTYSQAKQYIRELQAELGIRISYRHEWKAIINAVQTVFIDSCLNRKVECNTLHKENTLSKNQVYKDGKFTFETESPKPYSNSELVNLVRGHEIEVNMAFPLQPEAWYSDEWKGWGDFLSNNRLQVLKGKEKQQRKEGNLNILVNNDSDYILKANTEQVFASNKPLSEELPTLTKALIDKFPVLAGRKLVTKYVIKSTPKKKIKTFVIGVWFSNESLRRDMIINVKNKVVKYHSELKYGTITPFHTKKEHNATMYMDTNSKRDCEKLLKAITKRITVN